ncbi:MAG: type II toxin-antitoxin system PemK/MazF family toxin [Deltaproteobacteria bacterium]|nr:type II toxin-antitoxin system PemK/MazF family toxin [Deltaproteobacteria bacterium]
MSMIPNTTLKQGDIYWISPNALSDIAGSISHPHVIIQDNTINRSRIKTVVMCALTSNMKRTNEPGNVLLDVGEANLRRHSIVVVSQIETVNKTDLGQYIGTLCQRRIEQIFTGMKFQQKSFFDMNDDKS